LLTFENHVLWSLFQILSGGNRFYLLQYGDIKNQDDTQKLVIEVDIDGIPYFYIISLYELNAGMIYKVGNINLRSIGSEYSNKYEQKYEVKGAVTEIADWSETELAKMNVGYTVDGYDIYGYE